MKLYVRISGISPFILRLHDNLQNEHYKQIVEQYYSDIYNGRPPGPLFICKIVNFKGGDKLFEYKRKETLSSKFTMEVQEKTAIYDEPEACEESIIMCKAPAPELCDHNVPKIVSLNRLLLKLTDPFHDDYCLKVFWFQYRTFTKPKVVLQKILERFDVPPLAENVNYTYMEEVYYNTFIKRSIQEKVASMLYDWVQNYYFDFDDEMVDMLSQFCKTTLTNADFKGVVREITEAMKANSRAPLWQLAKPLEASTGGKLNKVMTHDAAFKLDNVTERELAEQLTLMDFKLYCEVKFTELLGQAWNKDKKRHMAPNIMNNINFLNKISSWVCYSILSAEDEKARKKIIKKFLSVLTELKDLASYNMIMAVYSALTNSAVHRLSNTWEGMDEKSISTKDAINEFISTQGNSKNFREAMNQNYTSGKPCAPYMGIYLKDLVFLDDGQPTYLDNKINYLKCMQTYNIMFQILRFQTREYKIAQNPVIVREITNFKNVDDDSLYKMSLQVQPRKS